MKKVSSILTISVMLLSTLSIIVFFSSEAHAYPEVKQLTKNGFDESLGSGGYSHDHVLSWDGSKVVFATWYSTTLPFDSKIYVMNTTDDPGQEKLMTTAFGNNIHGSISADGSKIVFMSNRDNPSDPWYSAEIFVMNTTDDPGDEIQITQDNLLDHDPDISGNGKIIAWHSAPTSWTGFDIVVANISDITNVQITRLPTGPNNDEYPSLTYDGKSMSFWTQNQGEVFLINSDGTGLRDLTNSIDFEYYNALCGDGSKVAFQRIVDSDQEIFVYDITHDILTQLTDNNADDRLGGINGDGTIVTYSRDGNIFIHDMTGENQLTDGDFDDRYPRISGDGSTIVFESNRDGPDYDIFMIRLQEQIFASVDIDPDTLNLKSNGQWIKAYVTLPEGYSVEDVDVTTVNVTHNDFVLTADWGEVQDGVLMINFDRAALRDYLGVVDVDDSDKFYGITLTVKGNVAGTPFEGSDTITVKRK